MSFGAWSERHCDDLLRDASPTYLYIGSSCAELIDAPDRLLPSNYARWMAGLRVDPRAGGSDPVEQIDVPAQKMSWHDFKDSTVRLALYRLKDPSICTLGPRYPWRAEVDDTPP